MWDSLSLPWQEAICMAWEAYCVDTIPIGAVVADVNGNIVARGRNRVFDKTAPQKQIHGDMLAHAELNALLNLELDDEARSVSAIYTTMEPCPLCMGAIYMSTVRTVHYAARDPHAGSVNLLGKTPYLTRKPIRVIEPFDHAVENAITAMMIESEIWHRGEDIIASRFIEKWQAMLPDGVNCGIELFRSAQLRERKHLPAKEIVNWLTGLVN
jgi:tRNA(adenine34) deaminase